MEDSSSSRGSLGRACPSLEKLCLATRFSRTELQTLYRGFKQNPQRRSAFNGVTAVGQCAGLMYTLPLFPRKINEIRLKKELITKAPLKHCTINKECPLGRIDRKAFCEIFSRFFPQGDAAQYASLVFDLIDFTACGSITFQEMATNLSILARGSTRDRLDWIFRLYDTDHDGLVSLEDLTNVLSAIYRILDADTKLALSKASGRTTLPVWSVAFDDTSQRRTTQCSDDVSPSTPSTKTLSFCRQSRNNKRTSFTLLPRKTSESFKSTRKFSMASLRRFSQTDKQSQLQQNLSCVVSQHASYIFKQMDANSDGVVDEDEFVEFCMRDPSMLEAIDSLTSNLYLF